MPKKTITIKLTKEELEIIIGLLEQEGGQLDKMQSNIDKEFDEEISDIDNLLKKLDKVSK